MADGGAVAPERMASPGQARLGSGRLGRAQTQRAEPARGGKRGELVARAEVQAAHRVAGGERLGEIAFDVELARDPGTAKADLVRFAHDAGERRRAADHECRDRRAATRRRQLAPVPEPYREGACAAGARVDPVRERRQDVGDATGARPRAIGHDRRDD